MGCCNHEEENNKFTIIKIAIAIVLFVIAKIFESHPTFSLILFIVSYILMGYEVLINTIKNLRHGEIFDENFLMLIATIGAFVIKEYSEASMVMILYQLGEFLQDLAVDKSKERITSLVDTRSSKVNIKIEDDIVSVEPMQVHIGDTIVVKPGEKILLDGIVTKGVSLVDTSSLTGESVPKEVEEGGAILSGCVNVSNLLEIKVTKEYVDSTATKIIEMIESSSENKSNNEKFISKFAKYYTPIVCGLALLIFIIPLIIGLDLKTWGYNALTFLVISCPCSLVISIPLAFFSGIGACSKHNLIVKGGNYLELASKIDTIVLDKTGTITRGKFAVNKINANGTSEAKLMYYVSNVERFSNHPIAKAICEQYLNKIGKVKLYKEYAGKGVSATVDNKKVLIGSEALLVEHKIKVDNIDENIYVCIDDKLVGSISISDEIKKTSKLAIKKFMKNKMDVIMLTGDNDNVASDVASKLGIKHYQANLLPFEKSETIKKLQEFGHKVMFVGDGINDAISLLQSDLGVAMGKNGQDIAIASGDIIIMNDDLDKLNDLLRISKRTLLISKENIVGALLIKLVIMILSVFVGIPMWLAVFADVCVCLLAVLNALTIFIYSKK